MTGERIGFIGLGNMGGPMAANVAKAGLPMVAFDLAGTRERAPAGADCAGSVAELAAAAEIVLTSLPSLKASEAVAEEIIASNARRTAIVVEMSTIGVMPARALAERFARAGIGFADAPVSGMPSGARDGTLSIMYGGPADLLERLRPAFEAMGSNVFHVGEKPGQGQAMKVVNNYLALLSLFATSEACAFGREMELDLAQMIDVLNVSSGRNISTMAMFPNWVLPGTLNMGFPAKGVVKDVGAFMDGARAMGTRIAIAEALEATVAAFAAAGPDADMMNAWPWTEAQRKG